MSQDFKRKSIPTKDSEWYVGFGNWVTTVDYKRFLRSFSTDKVPSETTLVRLTFLGFDLSSRTPVSAQWTDERGRQRKGDEKGQTTGTKSSGMKLNYCLPKIKREESQVNQEGDRFRLGGKIVNEERWHKSRKVRFSEGVESGSLLVIGYRRPSNHAVDYVTEIGCPNSNSVPSTPQKKKLQLSTSNSQQEHEELFTERQIVCFFLQLNWGNGIGKGSYMRTEIVCWSGLFGVDL